MKIALINPPHKTGILREGRCQTEISTRLTPIPQVSLSYMASLLDKAGHTCKIYDYIARDYYWFEWPDLAFVNTATPSIESDLEYCMKLKKMGAIVAVFGCHVSATALDIIATNKVDYVIRGEPEFAALSIASSIARGISSGTIVNHRPIDDLDSLGFPDRRMLPNNRYISPVYGKPFATITISRGCPHRCTFCTAQLYYGHKFRKRTPSHIIDEIKECILKYGIYHFWFYAEDTTCDRQYLKEICYAILQAKLPIKWWCNSRADNIDTDLANLMRDAGCILVSVGVESGDQYTLDRIKKNITLDKIRHGISVFRDAGIETVAYFIFGWPWDNVKIAENTIKYAIDLDPDYAEFYGLDVFPGTEIAQDPGVCGIDVKTTLRRAYRMFYFRPQYILKTLCKLSPGLIKFGIRRLAGYV